MTPHRGHFYKDINACYNKYMDKDLNIISNKKILIIYHAHCLDGFVGAWIARRVYGEKAEYRAMKRGEAFPDTEYFKNREVYVIDFSFTRDEIKIIESVANRLVIIDHHISSREEVESAKEHLFMLEHSGAYLAWIYFFKDKEVPLFIQYVSEGDIFKITLPDFKDLMPVVYAHTLTWEHIDNLYNMFETEEGREKLKEQSKIVSMYKDKILAASLDSVHWVVLDGVTMPAVNTCLPIDERSDLLHTIYTLYPPVALSYRWDEGQWKCSLRSNCDFDCTIIATKYGGGGHRGSAGFAVAGDMPLPFAIAKIKDNSIDNNR